MRLRRSLGGRGDWVLCLGGIDQLSLGLEVNRKPRGRRARPMSLCVIVCGWCCGHGISKVADWESRPETKRFIDLLLSCLLLFSEFYFSRPE